LAANKDVFSVLDTLLNFTPADHLAVELEDGDDGTGDSGGISGIATLNGGPVPGRVTMNVVVRLSHREGGCAQERNSGKLHCEEAYS
jgi:hypothetical protein